MEESKIADEITNAMNEKPSLSNVDNNDVVKTDIKWFDHPRSNEAGWSIGAVWGLESDKWNTYINNNVDPLVDKRKIPSKTNTEIGILKIRGDGEIVGHEIYDKFLKPTEQ